MKSFIPIFICLLVGLFSMSCDRTFDEEIVSSTPPELHILVENGTGEAISGVAVKVYKDEDDFNSDQNPIASETTDEQGKIILSESVLGEPGIFYVRASLNDMAGQGETPRILLTDGITYYTVTMQ